LTASRQRESRFWSKTAAFFGNETLSFGKYARKNQKLSARDRDLDGSRRLINKGSAELLEKFGEARKKIFQKFDEKPLTQQRAVISMFFPRRTGLTGNE